MFTPKGPHALNCHACISCCTKGAYAKTEEWIRLSATQTQTKRESKWLRKHRWLPLALVSVLHKWFENVFFFPRRPNFSLCCHFVTVLHSVCLSMLMSCLCVNHNTTASTNMVSYSHSTTFICCKMEVETTKDSWHPQLGLYAERHQLIKMAKRYINSWSSCHLVSVFWDMIYRDISSIMTLNGTELHWTHSY